MYQLLGFILLVHFFFILLLINTSPLLAQQTEVDGLRKKLLNRNLPDTTQIDLLIDLSQAYQQVQPDSSVTIGQQAQTLAQRQQQSRREMDARFAIAGGHYAQNQYDQALKIFQAILFQARQQNNSKLIAKALNGIGATYFEQSHLALAIEHLQKAKTLRIALQDSLGLPYTLNSLALVYLDMGNSSEALRYFTQALTVARTKSSPSVVSMILNNIGMVYEEREEYNRVLDYYQQSLDIDQETGSWSNVSIGLENVGITYRTLGDTLKALDHFYRGLYYAELAQNGVTKAKLLYLIGDLYRKQYRYDSAHYYLKQALHLSQSYNHPRSEIHAYRGLAQLYYQKKQYELAQQYASAGLALAQEAGQLGEVEEVATLAHQIYAARGDYQSAYRTHQLMKQCADSLYTIEKEQKLNGAMLANERLERANLERNHELQQAELALRKSKLVRQRNLYWSALVLVVLLLILTIFFFLGRRRLYSTNQTLQLQKKHIERQHQELATQSEQLREANVTISTMNDNLQDMVRQRTRQLEQYAYLNAHKVRGPVARVLGLSYLLEIEEDEGERRKLFGIMCQEIQELDQVIKTINNTVER